MMINTNHPIEEPDSRIVLSSGCIKQIDSYFWRSGIKMEAGLCVMVVIDVADAFDGLSNSENGFKNKVNKVSIDLSTKISTLGS